MRSEYKNYWLGVILTAIGRSCTNTVIVKTITGEYEVTNKTRMNKMVKPGIVAVEAV